MSDICFAGESYGELTVIKRDLEFETERRGRGQQKRAFYLCSCNCGNTTTVLGYNLKRGVTKSCGCLKRKTHKNKSKKDLTGSKFGNLLVLREDVNSEFGAGKHRKWVCECCLCGNTVSVRSSDLLCGIKTDCGCMNSKKISDSRTNDLTGKTFGHLTVICRDFSHGIKPGQHAFWLCQCKLCGGVEKVQSTYLRSGVKDRCHNCCKKSIGEAKIAEILDHNRIHYIRDKTYLDCKNDDTNYGLRFDFRVTDRDDGTTYLIEYDGLQHYKSAPMWDGNGDLEVRQRRDRIKTDWCLKNHIPLIRIPYTRLSRLCLDDLLLSTTKYRVCVRENT